MARPLLASSLTLEKGLLEWLGPWGVLRLATAAGRRLDLLQLPRSGFGQLALVPLGYLLLLLAVFGVPLGVEVAGPEIQNPRNQRSRFYRRPRYRYPTPSAIPPHRQERVSYRKPGKPARVPLEVREWDKWSKLDTLRWELSLASRPVI